ncbi:MAG: PQQ-binding-like beta-propeller repeat protein [Planctomycetaceae bacterium]|nr:PQQ-binding-like beta-propeller repeat protein [Planctomycetaceae bacterium]
MTKRHCHGWQSAHVRLFTIAGLFLGIGVLASRAADPPPPSLKSATPLRERAAAAVTGAEQKSDDESADEGAVSSARSALNPLLIRDRRHWLLLMRGDQALRQGESVDGISHFQALLDASQDAFYWEGNASEPLSAQANAADRLGTLTPPDRATYERLHGPAAAELLEQYVRSGDRRVLYELCRRFGCTAAARQAAVREWLLARDSGRTAMAEEWQRLLVTDDHHWRHLPPLIRGLLKRPLEISPHLMETSASTSDTISEPTPAVSPPGPLPLWTARFDGPLMPSEGHDRTAERQDEIAALVEASVQEWLLGRRESRMPIASANESLIAGDTLIVRDFANLSAFDLTSGKPLWKRRSATSLLTMAAERLNQQGTRSTPGTLDFDALFAGNPVFGRPTSDGQRVFVLECVVTASSTAPSGAASTDPPATSQVFRPNQLVALPLHTPSVSAASSHPPVWTRGAGSNALDDPLSCHIFLGSPLCVDDRVFVLTESDRQILLHALDAGTGATLWMQAVALLSQSASSDPLRWKTACSPVYSHGVVACPTEIGIIVGVDALTGRLQWVYNHLEEEQRFGMARWTSPSGRAGDRWSLPNDTQVAAGRMLHLPRRSAYVHCIDLQTGEAVWTQPRLNSSSIGGIASSRVLLVGERECRALDLQDGRQLWKTPIPEPAGLGVADAGSYLLPTAGGPCLRIDLETGQIQGSPYRRVLHAVAESMDAGQGFGEPPAASLEEQPRDRLRMTCRAPAGNLLAHRQMIVATMPWGVSVFAQARPMLERLESARPAAEAGADRLLQAYLHLTLGDEQRAAHTLDALLLDHPAFSRRDAAEQLLREILYTQIPHAEDPRGLLSRVCGLDRSDAHRLRSVLCQVDVALRLSDADLLTDALGRLPSLPAADLVTIDDGAYWFAPQQAIWERLNQLRHAGPSPLQERLQRHLATNAAALVGHDDAAALESFVTLYAGWSPVDAPRARLAQLWLADGRRQDAELLLLCDRFATAPKRNPNKKQQLAERDARSGRPQERAAAPVDRDKLLTATNRRPGGEVGFGGTQKINVIDTALVAIDPLSTTAALHRTEFGPSSSAPQVHVVEHVCGDACERGESCPCRSTRALHDRTRRRFVPALSSRFVVLDRGPAGQDKTESRLLIVDRDQGTLQSEVSLPAVYWQAPQPLTAETGHVMVIGGEAAFGLSLLEGKLLWSAQPTRAGKRVEKFKVGPIGSDYCVLQTSREIRVVHPATGRPLWIRSDLAPGTGLEVNDSTGIIGDSQCLAVFDADEASFTIYHTQSGRELGRGTRPRNVESARRQRWVCGRRLVELASDTQQARLTVWDSRENRTEFDLPLWGRLHCPLPNSTEHAYITAEARLQVLDVAEGTLQLDVPILLPPATGAGTPLSGSAQGLVVFADPQRYYVNLVMGDESPVPGTSAAEEQLAFPQVRLRGRLLAIDRQSGALLWDRTTADACLPLRPDCELPMLVLVRRSRDDGSLRGRTTKEQPQRLMLEVLDAQTGTTIGRREDLMLTQFVDCPVTRRWDATMDSTETQLSLLGLHSRVDVILTPRSAGLPLRTAAQSAVTRDR